MNIILEGLLYFLGGIIRFFDLVTDIWYVYTQNYSSDWLYYLSVGILLAPSAIFMLVFSYLSIADMCRGRMRLGCAKFFIGLVSTIAEPFGLVLCIFGCILTRKNSKKSDFFVVEALMRSAGFVEGIFESLPQLLIQSYNNIENDNWTAFTVASIAFSAGGFLYTCLKLLYALDKVRHYEGVHIQKQLTKLATIQTGDNPNRSVEEVPEVYEEVYNSEDD